MTQEEKYLVLRDLCARLPYNIIVDYESHLYALNEIDPACKDIDYITVRIQDVERLMCAKNIMIENIKPYLRSMSSMTEKEKVEYTSYCFEQPFLQKGKTPNLGSVPMCIDWLNAHHFDYRGLIPKGLAIEVTEEFNPYKN